MKAGTVARFLAGATATVLAAGCLERKETIRIAPDGAVHVELEYSGETQQFETADALPGPAAGWAVQRKVKREDNDKETTTLTARRSFEPREKLPASFAALDDPDADLYLAFPTTVELERRADGLYMHFRRTYVARPWAYVQFWQDQFVDDDIKQRADKPLEELTPEDRVRIVKAFAGFESFKQMELLQSAIKRLGADVSQDAWLRARQALLEVGEDTDWDAVVERVGGLAEDERDEAFEAESQRLLDRTYRAFVDELATAADWNQQQTQRFEAAYARAKKHYQITSEVGGHAFRITVHMPGDIVADNADKRDDDGALLWEFSGEAFRDRAYELMATAKLSGKGNDR